MTTEKNKTICALGWDHLHVTVDGWVAPCCIWNYKALNQFELYNLKDHTLEEAINSPGLKSMRKNMIAGKTHPLCLFCDKQTDAGMESARDVYNWDWLDDIAYEKISETNSDGSINPDKFSPRYIDVRFSNLCNMKCRMCSHQASSAWYDETQDWHNEIGIMLDSYYDLKFHNHAKDTKEKIQKFFNNVDRVYFAGGEPLILEEHYQVLKIMIESGRAKDIMLMYSTNLTVDSYKGVKLTEYWKHFKHVKLMGSVDGMGIVYNYIRTGGDWERTQKIFNSFKESQLSNIRVEITITVSIQNIFHLPDFIKWCHENEWMHSGRNRYGINFVQDPEELDILYLPVHTKEKIRSKFENLQLWLAEHRGEESAEDILPIINYLNKLQPSEELTTKMLNKLKFRLHAHDITANLDWQTALPEVKELLTEYKSIYYNEEKYTERDRK